jgi:hypothetical protein
MRSKTLTRVAIGAVVAFSLTALMYINFQPVTCNLSNAAPLPQKDTVEKEIEIKPDVSIISTIIHTVLNVLPSVG